MPVDPAPRKKPIMNNNPYMTQTQIEARVSRLLSRRAGRPDLVRAVLHLDRGEDCFDAIRTPNFAACPASAAA